jgi:2-polyprenyl-3-methyl-5-hydroxy-6-metoxy-1,4-benzoquinol methylase
MYKKKCPSCESDNLSNCFQRKDLLSVYFCNRCNLRFIEQSDFINLYGEINRLYEKEYFEGSGDLGYKEYSEIPITNFYWQNAFIQLIDEIKGKRILDIGCGTGKLMELLMKNGAEVEGIEISRFAADVALSKGLKVVAKDTLLLDSESAYDIITAFDVIEHVPDVKAFLKKVRTLLKDEGVFVFLTPDAGSERALTEKEKWYGYNSSLEHLYYFSVESLRFIINKVFGNDPIGYQATAPDGEGILGFIRKTPSGKDDVLRRLFSSNFPSEFINKDNVIPVCILLQRLNDRRYVEYVQKYQSFILANADKEELQTLHAAIDRTAEEKREMVSVNPATEMIMKIIPPHPPLVKGGRGDFQVKRTTMRKYQKGDENGIIKLFKEVFGREMTIDEWRWKYRGQGSERIHSVVALNSDHEIIGHYGGIPLRTLYLGKEIKILSTCDVMIHPAYRGFWMLKKITGVFKNDAINNGFRMCYGFPTEKTLMLPAERLGIIERCLRISEAKKDVNFNNNLNRFLFRLSPLNFDDKRINMLWKAVRGEFEFTVIRDRDYLKWRYKNNSVFSYEIWGLSKRWGTSLFGLAALKMDSAENLSIMDMIFRKDALIPLLQKIENLAFSIGKKGLVLWMPERYHNLLKKNGFVLKDYGVLGQIVGDDFIQKDEIDSLFYFSMGDTDYL